MRKDLNVRLLFLLVTAFSFTGVSALQAQQRGSIQGEVKTADGAAAAFVNVLIEGTRKGDVTNKEGEYKISGVEEGTYTLTFSYVGFELEEIEVGVREGEITVVPTVSLQESAESLQEVVVESYVNRFANQESTYVGKLPLKQIENPQVYTTISSELLEDQVVTSFDDALKNAPGLYKLWESTGRGGDGAGYYSLRGFPVQPTMLNGLPGLTNGGLDPVNIERIEVIKGPSGTLYGSSLISYGGLINIVTKKPYETFGGEIAYTAGSFGLNRVTADVNVPLNEEEDVALRVTGAYHAVNSFQDAGFKNSFFVAPSLSYEINDRLSFLVNAEFFDSESTNPTMLFFNRSNPLFADNLEELGYDPERSYTSNDLTIRNPNFVLQGQMTYELSPSWTSRTAISRGSAKTAGYYSYLWDIADGNGTFVRYLNRQNATTLSTDIQQNFIGDFMLGGLRNRLVAGLDYFQRSNIDNSTGYVAAGQLTLQGEDTGVLSRPAIDALLAGAAVWPSATEEQVYSAYVSDVINFTPKLAAMASVRVDYFDNLGNVASDEDDYDQTTFSPKFGLVYQPMEDDISLFANYMNGFSNVAPRATSIDNPELIAFEPEYANQWEAGTKLNLLNGLVTGSLSYYNITVSNVVYQDALGVNVQGGEVYSRGVEAEVVASPLVGLNLVAGYSYNKSEMISGPEGYIGRRPEEAGPEQLANLWATYTRKDNS
ncbi:TonB-dependent receptor [Nafulsella turpanensis]|uniref:TonB-dependent receptor n=1 Tax=Nafulsella turpanensis TaxID=1265690 RepID=UPI00034A6402|nr:TonB-dependent receptor [Nafulsella turpanensis]